MDAVSNIDIIILGALAAFLIFRLRSVLGRKTGEEQERPNVFTRQQQARQTYKSDPNDNVVPMRDRGRPDEAKGGNSLQAGVTQIRIADNSFDQRGFLEGAQMAFQAIVDAFARGDTATLRPLLSDDLYDEFGDAIRERLAEGHQLEHSVEVIDSAEMTEARMDGRTAIVTVRFVSQQIMVTRDEDGQVVDGDPDERIEVTDLWTFARNTRSTDPNWMLIETATPT